MQVLVDGVGLGRVAVLPELEQRVDVVADLQLLVEAELKPGCRVTARNRRSLPIAGERARIG